MTAHMNYNRSETEITQLINGNIDPRRDWIEAVQVTHIPYQRSADQYFLLVNVNVKTAADDRDSLLTRSLAVAQAIIRSTLLSDEKAVEVSVWVDVSPPKNPRRAFRLSILEAAYPKALQIKAADLKEKEHPGIVCQWPLQPAQ